MANFDIDEATLASILDSKEHHFNIPDFQRDFTWESAHSFSIFPGNIKICSVFSKLRENGFKKNLR